MAVRPEAVEEGVLFFVAVVAGEAGVEQVRLDALRAERLGRGLRLSDGVANPRDAAALRGPLGDPCHARGGPCLGVACSLDGLDVDSRAAGRLGRGVFEHRHRLGSDAVEQLRVGV